MYRKVASTNMRYWLKNQLFVKMSQYIRIENPLHKRSEKACMCFYMRRASTRDYTVYFFGVNNKLGYHFFLKQDPQISPSGQIYFAKFAMRYHYQIFIS